MSDGINDVARESVLAGFATEFATGAIRFKGVAGGDLRYDLISPLALKRLAAVYAEGCAKYGERNWEKGIPQGDLLNHALAHLVQWMAGDRAEDHLAHALWNVAAMVHFDEKERANE